MDAINNFYFETLKEILSTEVNVFKKFGIINMGMYKDLVKAFNDSANSHNIAALLDICDSDEVMQSLIDNDIEEFNKVFDMYKGQLPFTKNGIVDKFGIYHFLGLCQLEYKGRVIDLDDYIERKLDMEAENICTFQKIIRDEIRNTLIESYMAPRGIDVVEYPKVDDIFIKKFTATHKNAVRADSLMKLMQAYFNKAADKLIAKSELEEQDDDKSKEVVTMTAKELSIDTMTKVIPLIAALNIPGTKGILNMETAMTKLNALDDLGHYVSMKITTDPTVVTILDTIINAPTAEEFVTAITNGLESIMEKALVLNNTHPLMIKLQDDINELKADIAADNSMLLFVYNFMASPAPHTNLVAILDVIRSVDMTNIEAPVIVDDGKVDDGANKVNDDSELDKSDDKVNDDNILIKSDEIANAITKLQESAVKANGEMRQALKDIVADLNSKLNIIDKEADAKQLEEDEAAKQKVIADKLLEEKATADKEVKDKAENLTKLELEANEAKEKVLKAEEEVKAAKEKANKLASEALGIKDISEPALRIKLKSILDDSVLSDQVYNLKVFYGRCHNNVNELKAAVDKNSADPEDITQKGFKLMQTVADEFNTDVMRCVLLMRWIEIPMVEKLERVVA